MAIDRIIEAEGYSDVVSSGGTSPGDSGGEKLDPDPAPPSLREKLFGPPKSAKGTYLLAVFTVTLTFLLLLVPIALWFALNTVREQASTLAPPQPPISSITVTDKDGRSTTTTYVTSTVSLGAFDPTLGKLAAFSIGPLLFLIGAVVEVVLLLICGTLILGKLEGTTPLGLPTGTVRVFIMIMVMLSILIFAFLPNPWGENKAVTFLFGTLSTVIGFYFGSHKDDDQQAEAPAVALTISGVEPASGKPGETQVVTISGTGFTAISSVDFGGPSQGITTKTEFVVSTTLRTTIAINPNATPGKRDVIVSNPAGPSFTLKGGFTVSEPS